MSLTKIPVTHPFICRRGRWQHDSTKDSITASWSSARLEFIFRGDSIYFQPGANTRRIDRWNGGTPTILWTSRDTTHTADVNPLANDDAETHTSSTNSTDAFSNRGIINLDPVTDDTLLEIYSCEKAGVRTYYIQIILIDWASVVELNAIFIRGVSIHHD
jgi:hypothetical protein